MSDPIPQSRRPVTSRLVWRVMDRLTRHQFEHHEREVDGRLAELEARLAEQIAVNDALRSAAQVGAVDNEGSGELVLSRFKTALPSRPVDLVDCDAGRLWFPTMDAVMRPYIRETRRWEPEETAFYERHIQEGATVVNIGANVGYTAIILSRIVGPTGAVIAIEPEPFNFALLVENTRHHDNITSIHSAVGDTTGSITLHRSPDNAGDHRVLAHEEGLGQTAVPVVRLDDLLRDDLTIAALVCDTQGFDHRVVASAERLIRQQHPLLMVEFWPEGIAAQGDEPLEVVGRYRSLGYRSVVNVPFGDDLTDAPDEAVLGCEMLGTSPHTTLAFLP